MRSSSSTARTWERPRRRGRSSGRGHTQVGLLRVLLDRDSAAYKDLYRQRTATERINSQAKALGIERPKVRNSASVRNLNTLTYIVINVQALERAQMVNAAAHRLRPMLC